MKKFVVIPWAKYEKLVEQKTDEPESTYTQERILSTVPQKMKSRAQALLGLLPETDISWNNDGELVSDGQCIHGSNICDLVKCVLLNYKGFHPKGYDVFIKAMASNNVPESMIYNTKCRTDLQQAKCSGKPNKWLTM